MTLKELTAIVLEIRDNHLEHMKQDIDKIDEKVSKIDERLWAVVLLIIASIAAPIILKVLGV
jgi:hypothetical protein